ncbi:hypothetical protein [Mongoliitalea lutea]|uniref:Uncharacterized protein n=1 Tax=Mongoliitalea lutea TaxID=849756 RepID=A0A8J3D074_9BACT|nr:hypothetical protein [Mongoliitalea lutea]GHB44292.1 hypothetical protein GCM10008106_26650 [Mongoliitalea lutea]
MAYQEPEGFEGFVINTGLPAEIKEALGFQGFVISISPETIRIPIGFEGFIIAYSEQEIFLKVQDFRGFPIRNAVVQVNEPDRPPAFTDSSGLVALLLDEVNPSQIRITKNKSFIDLTYNPLTAPKLKTVVFQPTLME